MARGFFGGRKPSHAREGSADWPSLPGALEPAHEQGLDLPALAYVMATAAQETAATPEAELLERIAAFRGSVADTLFEISQDYQILCNLAHADLTACDETIEELRRRLAGDVHYTVLAKLDEIHALVAAQVGSAPTSDLRSEA